MITFVQCKQRHPFLFSAFSYYLSSRILDFDSRQSISFSESNTLRAALIPCNFPMCSKHLTDSPPYRLISPSTPPNSHLSSIVSNHSHHHSEIAIFINHHSDKPIFINHPFCLKKSTFISITPVMAARSVHLAHVEEKENNPNCSPMLLEKLEMEGIVCNSYTPGRYGRMLCPKCEGGNSNEWSLSLFIREDGELAFWRCFRDECGWKGQIQSSVDEKGNGGNDRIAGVKVNQVFKEENLKLEPLCNELIQYFSARMISGETLRRNGVMQCKRGPNGQVFIAFTYRRDGRIVNCKYRDLKKSFSQEKGAEKILYGLDDIKEASDIIIVEGEMDKLSMEEAGYQNCVSVPDGAPPKVSKKKFSSKDKDMKYQYLWNCEEYLKQASRIILATDADAPGQALAEELACRLGRERCWRVRWPIRNDSEFFKDANEVLVHLGPKVLKGIVTKAELFPLSEYTL